MIYWYTTVRVYVLNTITLHVSSIFACIYQILYSLYRLPTLSCRFPQDVGCRAIETQFTWGSQLLIVPVMLEVSVDRLFIGRCFVRVYTCLWEVSCSVFGCSHTDDVSYWSNYLPKESFSVTIQTVHWNDMYSNRLGNSAVILQPCFQVPIVCSSSHVYVVQSMICNWFPKECLIVLRYPNTHTQLRVSSACFSLPWPSTPIFPTTHCGTTLQQASVIWDKETILPYLLLWVRLTYLYKRAVSYQCRNLHSLPTTGNVNINHSPRLLFLYYNLFIY